MTISIPFDNSYARLPERFFVRVAPAVPPAPSMIRVNHGLATQLGLNPNVLESPEGLDLLSGRIVGEGSDPIAMAYAGHQFGNFVPQLGDGRAVLLGEIVDAAGQRRDIQLKGGGHTPFSRGGDGRAALGPVLREYVVSEAMAALGIPTTRALAAVTTGERVMRDAVLPGAVLTRVAASHIRVGTFQYFAARQDHEALKILADYVIARHYPEAARHKHPYRALLDAVITAQAELVARWLLVGFIHGVMNTDNCAVSGETIDYGPCAFMDAYDPATVFSSIDRQGRYAYGNQPQIAQWNLTRFAETLLPLLDENEEAAIADAEAALANFGPRFEEAYRSGLLGKIGLSFPTDANLELANGLLGAMTINKVDFTLFFRRLADFEDPSTDAEPLRGLWIDPTACDQWLEQWREQLEMEPENGDRRAQMRAINPAYIPRNHRVEAMIRSAVDEGDFAPFEELNQLLSRPYDDQPEFAHYADPPQPHERVLATYCGT
ncbi:MAG: protein adenylyltransferase SelO [Sphingobium sp.]